MPRTANPVDRIQVFHCRLPVKGTRSQGSGSVSSTIEVVVLRLETSSGVVGWGEAAPWSVFTGTPEAAYSALTRYLAPVVLGRDVSEIPRIMADADVALVGHREAKAALETALLDALGRLRGVAVHELLGGRYRGTIPLSVSLADPDFARDLELLAMLRQSGVGIVKLKTGFAAHGFDIERLERLKADHPGLDVRVDYNQGLQVHEAMGRMRDVATFAPTFIEQPVPGGQREAMAALTRAFDTPILADESVFTAEDAVRAVNDGIADLVSIKIMKCGGLRAGLDIAAIAGAGGMACYGGDMFETGIAHLAGTHMIAAAPNISLGCEFYQAKWYLEEDLLTEPFPIVDGDVVVPLGPGLGMDVDPAKVARFAITRAEVRN